MRLCKRLGNWSIIVAPPPARATRRIRALLRLRLGRYAVHGPSMLPTLREGDRLLILRGYYRLASPRMGDLVLARPAALAGRVVVKRLAGARGRGGARRYLLAGDNPPLSTDSRHFGPVARADLIGKVWLRYWPDARRGRIPAPRR